MTSNLQVKLSLDEDAEIVARIDAMAEEEGTSRAAIIRRAIRRLVFSSPSVPTFGNIPEVSAPDPVAK